jgi:uncharacterized protein
MDRIVVKLSLETRSANIIQSYEVGKLKIAKYLADSNPEQTTSTGQDESQVQAQLVTLSGSLILTPEILIENWLAKPDKISISDIKRVLETQPEVIIIGTGEKLVFPDNAVLAECHQNRIGVEVMNTPAACRTYNVLASERRKVAVAFTVI